MRRKKRSISLEEFALILVDLKFEDDRIIKHFNRLSEGIETRDDKLSNTRFMEYLTFDLFTDRCCFMLVFSREVTQMLFQTYYSNILINLTTKGYKIDNLLEFEALFNKRELEYAEYLHEYSPEYMKNLPSNYVSGLGKAFSMNFAGWKDPRIIHAVSWGFVQKLEHIGKYLREVTEEYEIAAQTIE
jgi:hypothetical protein